jgi:hypothetical protein
MKFRLLNGKYIGNDRQGNERVYMAGVPGRDVIDTDIDLKKYDFQGFTPKFERIIEGQPEPTDPYATAAVQQAAPVAVAELPDFNKMSLEQLKAYAKDEEIPLPNSNKREDLIKSIKLQYGIG